MWWSFIFNLGISTVIIVAKGDSKRFRLKDNPVESKKCKPTSTISINNVYVEDGKCNNSSCVLEDNDHELIYSRCNDTTSCLLDFNLTSPCLLGKRNFDLFYGCKEPESYACNFEQDFCKWLPSNWTRTKHTAGSGYYIGMDGIGSKVERHAELSTGVIVSNGSKCISFWYNMESVTGVQGSKLELFQTKEKGKSSLLKAYINSTETRWIRETLDLPGSLPYRIIFRGTVFEQWNNYIGLDDIDILPESCSGGNISEANMPGGNISENRFFQEHCLDFDDNFTIDGCPFLYLDTSKLRLVFEPAVETSNMECQGIENKTKDSLLSRCEEGAFSGCDVNQYAIISFGMSQEQECITYNKDIVLEYSCTESTDSSVTENTTSTSSGIIPVMIGSTLVSITVASLVIIVIVCNRKKRAKDLKPCHTQQNTTSTERINSSDYSLVNYNKMTDISIINIDKTFIKQDQNICPKYESLTTNRSSVEHIYESDSFHTNQYESLTRQRESDQKCYESLQHTVPQDINISNKEHQNSCNKYESLSINIHSDTHIYESDLIHTNQYKSLTTQQVSDKHTYESTEHALPVLMEQDLSQYQSLSNPPESDKHVYASTHNNQFESLTKQQESDKHTYETTEAAQAQDVKTSIGLNQTNANDYQPIEPKLILLTPSKPINMRHKQNKGNFMSIPMNLQNKH